MVAFITLASVLFAAASAFAAPAGTFTRRQTVGQTITGGECVLFITSGSAILLIALTGRHSTSKAEPLVHAAT